MFPIVLDVVRSVLLRNEVLPAERKDMSDSCFFELCLVLCSNDPGPIDAVATVVELNIESPPFGDLRVELSLSIGN